MDRTCSPHERVEKFIKEFSWEIQTERDHYEDVDVGRRIILKCILGNIWGDVDWINLAQDIEQCRAFVNVVMNPQVSYAFMA
jgi:hypothetical protein